MNYDKVNNLRKFLTWKYRNGMTVEHYGEIHFSIYLIERGRKIILRMVPNCLSRNIEDVKQTIEKAGYEYEYKFRDSEDNINEDFRICHDFIILDKKSNELSKIRELIL